LGDNSSETNRLLRRAVVGDREEWGDLLLRHQRRLLHLIALRLNPLLQGRIDPNDVLQEVLLEASGRLEEYLRQPRAPFYLWLRTIAGHKLLELHRFHLGTEMRDASREVPLARSRLPEASSTVLAAHLLVQEPADAVLRAELQEQVRQALDSLDPLDREALVLRHFEQLNTQESAEALGISVAAAGKRYLRALKRLKGVLKDWPGVPEGPPP
jgi:RNA polymerase sigma-70 factor (ECF subfamily)